MATKQIVPAVELEHVSKHFGVVHAVKNVSLVVEPGAVGVANGECHNR